MFLSILIALLIGTLLGIITGLTPGIHINLISLLILSASPVLLRYTSPLILVIIIISMAINHTFLDTIPSIFLGAPEEETALSVLPGHKYLLKGKGYEAVILTVIGSIFSLIISIILVPIIIPLVEIGYPVLQKYIVYVLLFVVGFLIIRERKSRKWALIVFLLAGVFGLITLNLPNLKNPLFPLLSGLFGTSMLFISFNNNTKIPKQKITFPKVERKLCLKVFGSTLLAGGICSFLPGLGPAQAAIIGSQFTKNIGNKGFLILVGGLNTVNMVLSFVALYIINKARNGAIVVVSRILESINLNYLILFLGCALFVAGIAVFLALFISKIFSRMMSRINYRKLCLSVIILITALVILLSGFLGFFILIIATCIGVIPALKGIGRNHMMGCLILPVILYFF